MPGGWSRVRRARPAGRRRLARPRAHRSRHPARRPPPTPAGAAPLPGRPLHARAPPPAAARTTSNPRFPAQIIIVLDHPSTLLIFTVMTLWALFMEEIRVAADLPKAPSQPARQCDSTPPAGPRLTGSRPSSQAADKPFASISFTFMLLFAVELVLRSWAQGWDYFLNFFWWLDFVATGSMAFDILPVFQAPRYTRDHVRSTPKCTRDAPEMHPDPSTARRRVTTSALRASTSSSPTCASCRRRRGSVGSSGYSAWCAW